MGLRERNGKERAVGALFEMERNRENWLANAFLPYDYWMESGLITGSV